MHTAFMPEARARITAQRRAKRHVSLAAWATLTALAGALVAGPAQAAGTVQVNFVQPAGYSDIGLSSFDREHNLRALQAHFTSLAKGLPDGQTLQVDVLDVDLAGEILPQSIHELRVLRGGVDWPRITLRYTLTSSDTTLAQGEERLSDPSYMFSRSASIQHQPLPYERRMLEEWFNDRFSAP
jgi:hypothetical protein